MDVHYPAINEPATLEYILAVLQDMHRQQCQWDPTADPTAELSLETTVAEWRDACDLQAWKQLGRACNDFWGVSIPNAEWRSVLEPSLEKRLAGVCELLASRVNRPVIRPARLFGCICGPAGAFLTIRSLLHDAGEKGTSEIAPSTLLGPYLRRYTGVFLGPISLLAPGSLPPVRIHNPIYDAGLLGSGIGWLAALIGACVSPWLVAAGAVLFVLGCALTWISVLCLLPASVEFGELRTFRDLAIVVAEGKPAKPRDKVP